MWLLILSSPAIPTNVNALRYGLAARGSGAYAPSQRRDARVAPAASVVIGRLGGHTLERSICGRFPRRGHLAEWCWAWRTTSLRRALAS